MSTVSLEELGLRALFSLTNVAMTDSGVEIGPHWYLQLHLRSELEVYVLYREFPAVGIDVTMPLALLFPALIEADGLGRVEPTPPWRAHSNTGELSEAESFPREALATFLESKLEPLTAEVTAARSQLLMEEAVEWLRGEASVETVTDPDRRADLEDALQLRFDTRLEV